MKKTLFILFLSVMSLHGIAQKVTFFPNTGEPKVLNASGDTLLNPFGGGMSNPMFSNIDLNFDGKNDLIIFDHGDSSIAPYLYGSDGKYRYAPEYAAYFPSMIYWANLVDYNHDGLPDIFAYSHERGGLEIYKNVSSNNMLKFKMVVSFLDGPNITCNCITPAQVYADQVNLPLYADMDGDNDIDILSIDGSGIVVDMYKNRSHEIYNNFDSLNYEPTDLYWGGMQGAGGSSVNADDFAHPPTINLDYGTHCMKQKHAGANMAALDADGDGDMDILYCDINGAKCILLVNGKKENKAPFDTIVKVDTAYLPHICRYFPAPYYVDIDNDGVRDLILSPTQLGGAEGINNVVYYHNDGKDNLPKFTYKKDNLLQEDEIDLGYESAPAFLDRNGDGIPEYLAVATAGNLGEASYGFSDRIVLYQNINLSGKPVFKMINNDWLALSTKGYRNISPAFGDMDGDGLVDLLLGKTDGQLVYFHNTGTSSTDNFVFEVNAFIEDSIDVGSYSTPAIADINSDGIADLVIGNIRGKLAYYKGLGYQTVGAKKLLNYELVNDFLGNIVTDDPTDTSTGNDAASAPVITDFNKDGKLDMLCGSATGSLFLYMDIQSNLGGTMYPEQKFLYNQLTTKYENPNFGKLVHPAVALLNGDNLPDIVAGGQKGGLFYYSSHALITGNVIKPQNTMDVKIYPNPANSSLNISSSEGIESYQLVNMMGQLITSQNNMTLARNLTFDISTYPDGIYIIHLQDSAGRSATEKVLIRK